MSEVIGGHHIYIIKAPWYWQRNPHGVTEIFIMSEDQTCSPSILTLRQLYRKSLFDLVLFKWPHFTRMSSVWLPGWFSPEHTHTYIHTRSVLTCLKLHCQPLIWDSWQDDLANLRLMATDDEWKINYSWWLSCYCKEGSVAEEHLLCPFPTARGRAGEFPW